MGYQQRGGGYNRGYRGGPRRGGPGRGGMPMGGGFPHQ